MILKDLVFMHSPFSPHHQPAEPEDTVTLYDVFQGAIPYGVAWDLNVRMLNCEYLIALQTKAQEYKLWYRRCLARESFTDILLSCYDPISSQMRFDDSWHARREDALKHGSTRQL